jgi:hypothetical protein
VNIKPWHLLYIAALLLLISLLLALWGVRVVKAQEDTKIGVAFFRIWHKGDEVMAEPLIAPAFKLHTLVGTGIEPTTLTKCVILKRTLDKNEERELVVTVLRCGINEYGVSEVVFDTEGK